MTNISVTMMLKTLIIIMMVIIIINILGKLQIKHIFLRAFSEKAFSEQ